MIRILHVVHTMECGGIETMLMNIYRKIDRNKIQFDFLVNGKRENYYTDEIIAMGGNVYNVTPKRENFKKNIQETIKIMQNGNYQLVHIHQDSMIAFGIYCAKKANIDNIFVHAHTTSALGWYRKMLTYVARNYIRKNASIKFACSDAAANWIYGKKTNYILFKNAIDALKFKFDKKKYESVRKKLKIKSDDLVIGTCGRLSVEKNQKFLIEIFSKLKTKHINSKLILVGDGDRKDNLIKLAEQLGVIDDIIFTGMVDNVEYYYNAFDYFMLPSFYEGLPLVGVEAQAAGIPCIFSTGVTKEIKVTKNVHFISLNEDAAYWSDFIINHLEKRTDTYDEIKKSGYDIGANVELLQSIYLKFSSKKRSEKE